jgi:MFS family permease
MAAQGIPRSFSGLVARIIPADRFGRLLVAASLADAVGTGLFTTGSVIFFVRWVHLTAQQVGLGLTLAGIVGSAALVPIGILADRFGARRLLVLLHLWRAAGYCVYIFIGNFAAFVIVVSLMAIADRAAPPVMQAIIAGTLPSTQRVRTSAHLRATKNVGFTLGTALAGLALQLGSRSAFNTLILADAGSFLVTALLVRALPARASLPPQGKDREKNHATGLPDGRYLALTVLNGVLSLHETILAVGLALWLVGHTRAPQALLSILLALNTVLVVVLQTPFSRYASSVRDAASTMRVSGLLLAVGCLLVSASGPVPSYVASLLLIGCAVVFTVAEMLQSVGAWELSMALAPEAAQGRYLAVFAFGRSLQFVVGPLLIATVITHAPVVGWGALAMLFVLVGLAAARVALAGTRHAPASGGSELNAKH